MQYREAVCTIIGTLNIRAVKGKHIVDQVKAVGFIIDEQYFPGINFAHAVFDAVVWVVWVVCGDTLCSIFWLS